jgi:hypothetical protein
MLGAYFAILCMCFLLPYFLLRKGNLWIVFVFQLIEISFLPGLVETPLEEFELQLMDAESRMLPPCHITFCKHKRRNVPCDDE